MAFQKFLIGGPFKSGLETDKRPFLLAEDAFERLDNAYVFRGRVRKRFGSTLLGGSQLTSRLRIQIDTTDGGGNAAGNVPGIIFQVGQMFSIGSEIYTVDTTGAPAALLSTGAGTGTYNTTTGAYTFAGAPAATAVYFYPATSVMGFTIFENQAINNEPTVAYDTQFAYRYFAAGWDRLAGGSDTWTGSNSQFFWSENWQGSQDYETFLFTTNYNVADQIRYWDGAVWTVLNPVFNAAGDTIETCRVIIAFKDRLLFFNTIENIAAVNRTFVNRGS